MRVGTLLVWSCTALEPSSAIVVDSLLIINDFKLIIVTVLLVLLTWMILLEGLAIISVWLFIRSSLIIAAFILLVMLLSASECLTRCDSEGVLFKVHGLEGALRDQVDERGLTHLVFERVWCVVHFEILPEQLFL
jgi:hypothetical protein